jgi:hypothetical protein
VFRRDIDRDAIGVSAVGDDDLAVGAVRISETTRSSLRSRRNRRPVADTNLKTGQLRGIALCQALLSYFFGAIILAVTINLVVGLSNSGV